ncbi:hypothetical protein COJ67_30560 [Bacillus thuringiensis]|nr:MULTISPECIES: hypothetical protein [Bacillus cereus group]MEB9611849.1 hypothetical protein [Bacillus cereus]PFN81508.1 hypothetical protein COJ67_30560 [Bacillus thuringiensis]PFO64993.1 hypothetical protein COJ83_20600 [Bacillus cereus]PGW87459.1 hypothetical protein COE32_29665 [Bacillus cereus]PGX89338.1 hypothetical protein COE41_30665 [Bacillus thuringiensis]
MFQTEFDKLVQDHLNSFSEEYITSLKNVFMENQLVILEELIPKSLIDAMSVEAKYLLLENAKRRDIIIKATGNTPRNFNVVNRDSISKKGKIIPAFFKSEVILNFLTFLNNNEPVYRIPYTPEEFIINNQQKTGDTHGWHWDDYTFALIWVIEAPKEGEGAIVEYIPNTVWDKEHPGEGLRAVLKNREIQNVYVPQGHCYFMKAGTTLHRVTPLKNDSCRTVVVFSYASEEDLSKDISHETLGEIYEDVKELVEV